MFKIVFQYYNKIAEDQYEESRWAETKEAAYEVALEIARSKGNGHFELVALYDFSRQGKPGWIDTMEKV